MAKGADLLIVIPVFPCHPLCHTVSSLCNSNVSTYVRDVEAAGCKIAFFPPTSIGKADTRVGNGKTDT